MVNRRQAVGLSAVIVASLVIGGFMWGNLFTLITGEFPGPGPGFDTKIQFKTDTTTVITTTSPERFTHFLIPQLELWYWQATGKMTPNGDGGWDILFSHHVGVLTTLGKNFIEDQLGDSPGTDPAHHISLTTSASSPAAGWGWLPMEIVDGNGLARALGSYTSTGDGVWTIVKQFTATAGYTNVQCTGLNWDTANNTLLCADTFTPVTLAASDKITITWTISVT